MKYDNVVKSTWKYNLVSHDVSTVSYLINENNVDILIAQKKIIRTMNINNVKEHGFSFIECEKDVLPLWRQRRDFYPAFIVTECLFASDEETLKGFS